MDEAAVAMQQRVRFVGRDDWTDLEAGRRAIVTIKTRTGAVVTKAVQRMPMTADELINKFNGLMNGRFNHEKTVHIAALPQNLAGAGSVRPLMTGLAAG